MADTPVTLGLNKKSPEHVINMATPSSSQKNASTSNNSTPAIEHYQKYHKEENENAINSSSTNQNTTNPTALIDYFDTLQDFS
ncbi:unnamed protein product [Citrullus colocynthis]|uniref:Uncharacterized protein n=1 Tax=Citrullus colocynthis TaxID=252529 RepID=A0ABP0Y7X0_9ROSI